MVRVLQTRGPILGTAQHITSSESRQEKVSLAEEEDTPGIASKASPSAPLQHFLENSVSPCSTTQGRITKESRILLLSLLILRPSRLWPLLGPTYLMYAPYFILSSSPCSLVFWVLKSWFTILEYTFESWNSLEALARTSPTAPNSQCLFNEIRSIGTQAFHSVFFNKSRPQTQRNTTHYAKRRCSVAFFYILIARAQKNIRRGIHYNKEINKDHGEPRIFLLSSLYIMVQLSIGIIADQFHLINNLK